MVHSSSFAAEHRRFISLLRGILNLAFMDPRVDELEAAALNHPSKSITTTLIFHKSPAMIQQLTRELNDAEFGELRRAVREVMHNHRVYRELGPPVLGRLRLEAPEFDWDVVIASRSVPVNKTYKGLVPSSELSANDRRFLKSLRLTADEPQPPDRKG